MIEKVADLPAGVLGFRASGKIMSDEYRRMMEPIYAALERGEKLNIYFELAGDVPPRLGRALAGRAGGRLGRSEVPLILGADGARHRHGLGSARGERVRLAPGELRLFEPSERKEARAWLDAGSPSGSV